MKCAKPYRQGAFEYGCGQCLSCRINRRRVWMHRLLLESKVHESSVCVTLTYDDEHLPEDLCVSRKAGQRFMRDLRKLLYPVKVRFFLVGEYGEESTRPHYHAILFGVPLDQAHGFATLHRGGQFECVCGTCELVRQAWRKGRIEVQPFTVEGAQYVCGYVTKKLTGVALPDREPEFATMSLRPGIGALSMPAMAEVLSDATGAAAIGRLGDVPSQLRHGKRLLPLGRYLMRRLREEVGMASFGAQTRYLEQKAAEVRAVSETLGVAEARKEADRIREVKVLQDKTRFNIHQSKGKL